MDWDDSDPMTLNASAMREAVPPTLPAGQKKTKAKFGINVDTEFQSPTNNTNATLGFAGRKTSQGRLSSNSRGGDVLISGARADVPRKVIVPGQSLSINQPQQLSMDTFNRAVVSTNTQGRKPELVLVSSKTSNGYRGFQENMHSNNVSPNAPSVSKIIQRLLPHNSTTHTEVRSQSADLAYIGHVDPSRTTNTSATTNRPSSRNSTQAKGTGRPAIQSYEEKMRAKQVEGESNLRPRSREHNNNYPISNNLQIRPSFTTPHNKNANGNNASTTNTTNSNTRSTRNSARKSPSNEVIDLVDSDIEEVESIHLAQQQQDSEIFRLYGSLPGFTDQQKRNAFSKTEERLPVQHIYLGIYRFDSSNNSNSSARKLYLRVDGGNNQCILLGLNNDTESVNTSDPDGAVGTEPIEIEEIPFDKIKKIICGPVRANATQAFITLSVYGNLSLNSVHVGPNCMLCPTLTQSTKDSGKYVLIMLSTANLETFVHQMKAVPFVSKKKNLNDWLSYRSNWFTWETKDFLFAHNNRNEHSIEELRERALLEQETKSKNQRRKNRSSLRNGGNGDVAVADPEDCLTYAMYPIEPEVLDAITIFKGDLKKLAPEEYLNDNLIDLKIKHLAATQLTPAQVSAIHVFNCMFYTCLTTPKSPEQGHKVVSRWTNKVDLFAKDYIIIPINYSYHWSLAVIIRPGAVMTSLAQLQADIANWQKWTSTSNSKSQPNSAKKSTGSANKKKTATATAVDDVGGNVVQDLTFSNSNTQNSAANGSGALENGNSEGKSPSAIGNEEVAEEGEAEIGADNMDVASEDNSDVAAFATPAKKCYALDVLQRVLNSTSTSKLSAATLPIENSDSDHSVSEKEEETNVNRACIIHMDSLGMHSTAAVGKALRSYLRFEWEARKKAELDAELDALLKSDVNKDISEEEVAKMKKSLEGRRLKVFNSINVTKIKVPIQANGYDCGLFVTKFAELVLNTQPSSTDADIESKFGNILRSDAFSQVDVDGERKNMLAMIEGIRKDWENLRHQLKLQQQQQSEAAAQPASSESDTNQNNDDGEGDVAAGDDAEHRMTCNKEEKEADGENSVEDEGEEDLGAVYADVPVASVNSSRNHAHYSSSAGKKRLTVAEDQQSASREADTVFDSLISGDAGRSPPIGSSSSSNSNSNSAGEELDTQDSTRYMDCGDGGDGGESTPQDEKALIYVPQSSDHTQQSQSTDMSVFFSPGNASPPGGERVEGDRKRKKEQKRKRSDREKDRADLGAEPSAAPAFTAPAVSVDVAFSNDATPTASGKTLFRTTSSVAAAFFPDGTLPVEIKGGFLYKALPSSKRHKHKKSSQDREESGTVGSPSPVVMARESASKSHIVPVDMSTLGGPLLSVVASSDRMDTSGNLPATAGPDGTAEDLEEDVGEPVQAAYSADHSAATAASVGGDRSVTKQYSTTATDFLNQAPEDHTLGPTHASSQDKHKKYGRK